MSVKSTNGTLTDNNSGCRGLFRTMSKQHHSFVGDMVITFLLRKNGDGWLAQQVDMHDVFRRPADVQQ